MLVVHRVCVLWNSRLLYIFTLITPGFTHNSVLNISYWVSGTVLYQQQGGTSPIKLFSPSSRPNGGVRSLSLDWIGRRLFWVEQVSTCIWGGASVYIYMMLFEGGTSEYVMITSRRIEI